MDSDRNPRRARSVVHDLASLLARVEPWLILALAPLFMFPQPGVTPWLMIPVPLLWLARWLARGRLTVRTPVDVPLLIMMAMVVVSIGATFDLRLSFPKICGVFLGVALFYALVNAVHTEEGIWLVTGLLLVGGAAVAGVSLLGTGWSTSKVPLLSLDRVYERLPPLVRGVPRAEQGFNPNQVGGTLVLFIPLAAALLLDRFRRATFGLRWLLSVVGLGASLGLTVTVLLLTQSRLAYASAALALLLLGILRGGWVRPLSLIVLALGIGLTAYVGLPQVAQGMFGVQVVDTLSDQVSAAGRMEIWRRALRAIQDHPLTGIGFDTLFPVIHARYPTFLLSAARDATHAHNIFLQVALDLGLPGLGAFIWLLAALGRMLWRVWRRAPSPAYRSLGLGLLCGIVAQLFFGVADAIALGQKPGLFLWAFFGLGAALWATLFSTSEGQRAQAPRENATGPLSRPRSIARGLLTVHYRSLLVAMVLLLVVSWGWRCQARARSWLSLIRADLAAMTALGQDSTAAQGLWHADELLHQTRSDLQGVKAEFALPLTLASHLGWMPRWGADVAAVPRLLRIGLLLAEVGEQALEPLRPLLESERGGPATDKDLALVARAVRDAAPGLEEGLANIEEARQIRGTIRTDGLSPQLAEWVARLDRTLPMAEDGLRAALALPELLGISEPRTYLVLVQNEDELRPTGGFISGAGRMTLAGGSVSELVFEDSYAVDDFSNPYPEPPRPLYEIMGAELWVFRDSNWSPDFPTSAQRAVELYQLRHDVALDGVVALDQRAVQLLVTALEPLEVEGYPEPVTGENVIEAVRQSWAPSPEEGITDEWWLHRKDFMGDLLTEAVVVMQQEPERVSVPTAVKAAIQALEERHLLVYVPETDPAAGPIHEAGWDGAVRDVPGDYLMVVDANLGFNKVDPYVRETITYTVDLREPNRPRAELTLEHRHQGAARDQPCRHEPRYDLTYKEMMQRCYWDYARVYVPKGAHLLDATSRPVPGELLVTGKDRSGQTEILSDEGGKSVFATFLVLPPGEREGSEFAYAHPTGMVEQNGDTWRYRLYAQKQPGTHGVPLHVEITLPSGGEVLASEPKSVVTEEGKLAYDITLDTDRVVDVTFRLPE